MAKGKKKPASKSKTKKVEPILKDEAVKVKKVPKKDKTKKEKEKKIPVPKSSVVNRPHVESKHAFPEKDVCKHLHTKRTIDRRLRVMHVCTNPLCKKVVRFGSR